MHTNATIGHANGDFIARRFTPHACMQYKWACLIVIPREESHRMHACMHAIHRNGISLRESRLLEEGVLLVVVGAGHGPAVHEVRLVLLAKHGRQSHLAPTTKKAENDGSAQRQGQQQRGGAISAKKDQGANNRQSPRELVVQGRTYVHNADFFSERYQERHRAVGLKAGRPPKKQPDKHQQQRVQQPQQQRVQQPRRQQPPELPRSGEKQNLHAAWQGGRGRTSSSLSTLLLFSTAPGSMRPCLKFERACEERTKAEPPTPAKRYKSRHKKPLQTPGVH